MKKLITLFLTVTLLLSLTACGAAEPATAPQETSEATTAATEATTPQTSIDALDGKKIIFIGNSYTFYGRVVHNQGYTTLTQKERTDNRGLFYYLCKEKGIDVEVTNWTFGGHDISDLFDGPCNKGDDKCSGETHEYYLQDRYFDYVCIQPYKESDYAGNFVERLRYTMDFFREANPNVCFLLLVPQMAVEGEYTWLTDLEDMKKENVPWVTKAILKLLRKQP